MWFPPALDSLCMDERRTLPLTGWGGPQREPSPGCRVADQPEANRRGVGSQADAKQGRRGCFHEARTDQPAQERGGAESKRQMPAPGACDRFSLPQRARAEAAPWEWVGEQAINERRKKARVAHTSTIFSTPHLVWTYVRAMATS